MRLCNGRHATPEPSEWGEHSVQGPTCRALYKYLLLKRGRVPGAATTSLLTFLVPPNMKFYQH